MSIFLKRFTLPTDDDETSFFYDLIRASYGSIHPFKFFPEKGIEQLSFSPVTIFYGNNGSGKSTLLNIIAEKTHAYRRSPYSGSEHFSGYVKLCKAYYVKNKPENIQILTSDDVSEYILDMRYLSNGIDNRREELFEEYSDRVSSNYKLTSLKNYGIFKESQIARRTSKHQYASRKLMSNPNMRSNGETAMQYFVDTITENGIYLMDEPENSLSPKLQMDLMRYISDSARHFNCQFIIATHSPILLSISDAKIYNLDHIPVDICKWNELENIKILQQLFKSRENEFI